MFAIYASLISVIGLLIIDTEGRTIIDVSDETAIIEMFDERDFQDLSWNVTARNKAAEHFKQIEKKVCNTPVAKLFPVYDIYPTGKRYKPHCVELHRCNNDAGCCKEETMVCAPVETQTVYLHISSTGLSDARLPETKVFLMPFENHTRCECQFHSAFYD